MSDERRHLGGSGFKLDCAPPDKCHHCGGSTEVVDSRKTQNGYIRRRRECVDCGDKFTTIEVRNQWFRDMNSKIETMRGMARVLRELN